MSVSDSRRVLGEAKRIVIKVGSSLLAQPASGLDLPRIASYARQISVLVAMGKEVILVSSGAVAAGCMRLGWRQRPSRVHELQAAAAVGQMGLVQAYEATLRDLGCGAAMIMLTHDDLADRQRYLNARATLNQLLDLKIVPVINENDTVATEEIRFGDNDTLAALVTNLLAADALVILTDVAGLLESDPRDNPTARRIAYARADDSTLDAKISSSVGSLGRGGMVTKLRAARIAARSGANTVIASGHEHQVLERLLVDAADLGTLLVADVNPIAARKAWIAGQLKPKGEVVIDPGAVTALQSKGVSLLAVGVSEVRGEFVRGEVVQCIDATGRPVAQGLVNYSDTELRSIRGLPSDSYNQVLSIEAEPEVIHRDNLVLL